MNAVDDPYTPGAGVHPVFLAGIDGILNSASFISPIRFKKNIPASLTLPVHRSMA